MKIYNYNYKGIYVGYSEADESPLEPGVFLIPANATTIAPIEVEDGFAPFFDGAKWVAVDMTPQPIEKVEEIPKTSEETVNPMQEQIDTLALQILMIMGV